MVSPAALHTDKRRTWFGFPLLVSALLGVGSITPLSAAESSGKPNILLIFSDDQSYKTVACYPGAFPWVKTPNIDALAKSGVRFDRAYLGSWCMPSRASMLTGMHPHAIETMRMEGTYPGSTYDPKVCRFWPSVFRQHGYHTAHIGKWHTGTDSGLGRDWDHQIVWNRPKHPDNAGNYYEKQIVSTNGVEKVEDGYSTDNYTKWACEYIRGAHRPKDKPWYLWLCYGGVHGPSTPAARHKGIYKDAPVVPPADLFPPRLGKPEYLNQTQAWRKGPDGHAVTASSGEAFGDTSKKKAKSHADWVRQVTECVPSMDEGVGAVIQSLKESGQLENTLIVYVADQGFSMGEHGFRTKLAPYDANYASPLIVSMPARIAQGQACSIPVNAPDLVMTFFAFAGLDLPWPMHGRDLTAILKDPTNTKLDRPLLYEHTGHSFGSDVAKVLTKKPEKAVHSNVPWYAAVRVGKWKYIRYLKPGVPNELYDLTADPEELTNLAGKPEHAKTVATMREIWLAELKRTHAGFLDSLPR